MTTDAMSHNPDIGATGRSGDTIQQTMLDAVPVLIGYVDATQRFRWVNRAYERWFGRPAEAFVGHTLAEVHPPQRLAVVLPYVERALQGEAVAFEDRTVDDEGGPLHFRATYLPDVAADGTVLGFTALVENINARKQAEAELAESHERFAGIVALAADGIIAVDSEQRIQLFNQAAERIFSWQEAEVLGRPLELLIPPQERDLHRDHVQAFAESAESARRMGERRAVKGLRRDGSTFPAEVSIAKLPTRGGVQHTAIVRDVSRREQLEAQLRQSQKLEAIGQLAGGIAHDFNNLLQIMRGYTEVALAVPDLPEKVTHAVERVQLATDKAADLTRKLLAFGRRDVLDWQPVRLHAFLEESAGLLRHALGEGLPLEMALRAADPTVSVDAGLLSQALMNLTLNAADAMPDGGTVSLETDDVAADEAFCRAHGWAKPGAYVRLTLRDTGHGIPEDIQERVFEPFFTTKEPDRGTGLGLATAYGIVQRHDGMLEASSTPGVGTAMAIFLPRHEAPSAAGTAATSPAEPHRGTETILVAEDQHEVLELVQTLLEGQGYRVIATRDGMEALLQFRAHRDEVDLALLDLVMPKASGRQVFMELRRERPELPVVFSSGYALEVVDDEFIRTHDVKLIRKPFAPADLFRAVREALAP